MAENTSCTPNLRFLFDTNILIPLEPTLGDGTGLMSIEAGRLLASCHRAGIAVYLHPASRHDLERDKNLVRQGHLLFQFQKYPVLVDPPCISGSTAETIGQSTPFSNDWVDDCLLEAMRQSCAHFLVTEDKGIHRKARKLGLNNIIDIREANVIVSRLFDRPVSLPPAVEDLFVYQLDKSDSIFDSFREDYPGFDLWLQKCCRDHRKAWVIKRNHEIGAIAIYKLEDGSEIGVAARTLKLCSFKVADEFRGFAFGELLLRSAYQYVRKNHISWIYLTAFAERQSYLVDFLLDQGFAITANPTSLGEVMLAKPAAFSSAMQSEISSPVEVLRRFGPFSFLRDNVGSFIVPIQPEYHRLLFPDTESQQDLFPGYDYFANAIHKAYLCNASLRSLRRGDLIFFYRSGSGSVAVAGAIEDYCISSDAASLAAFVGKRTVYSFEAIAQLASKRDVLAILFMTLRNEGRSISLDELIRNEVVNAPPQSIQSIPKAAVSWLLNQLQL